MGRRRSRRPRKSEDSGGQSASAALKDGCRMLMNVVDPGEIRVAISSPKGLEEVYIEKSGGEFVHGNIFKGKVENVEPNLQAAFINIGAEKNGFLHVSDIIPPFGGYDDILKRRRRKKPSDPRKMTIDQMLYKGQEVLVQITRESVSTKGPSLTTYISLPGRFLVLMPAVGKRGVSRKITGQSERDELKKALEQLEPPKDLGFIIRTAGMGKGKDELQRDLDYLTRLWEAIAERTKQVKGPAPIYQESDLVIRAIRDNFRDDIAELVIDAPEEMGRARDFFDMVIPDRSDCVKLYEGDDPIFHHYGVENEIAQLFDRSVRLKCGGELIVEQTEAMVTIDVNTGSYLKGGSTREMILSLNLEAAAEVARQLRLRDMGGLIMIDFIDMETSDDRRKVENALREAMYEDRARVTMLPISGLGVMEMTRQRVRKSLRGSHYQTCPMCNGTGITKNRAALEADFIRRLRLAVENGTGKLGVGLNPLVALDMANHLRGQLFDLEKKSGRQIEIVSRADLRADEIRIL